MLGVYVLNLRSGKIEKVIAGITLLATGETGRCTVLLPTPLLLPAMVWQWRTGAKGRIENMEFIQFHPTALYEAGVNGQAFLITEAVRGDGGILRNSDGEAFMEKYDDRKDLARVILWQEP